jgi:hypothetical protein
MATAAEALNAFRSWQLTVYGRFSIFIMLDCFWAFSLHTGGLLSSFLFELHAR